MTFFMSARSVWLSFLLLAVLAGCDSSSPTEPTPPPCTFTVSAASLSFGPSGGSGSVTVTTASQCTWAAVSSTAWITIAGGGSGTGSGTVTISVAANPTHEERTATLTVAGQPVMVREEGRAACTVDIAPSGAVFDESADTDSFRVIAAADCPWSAASNAAWIRVTSGGQGTGDGTVFYAVERNAGTASRTGAIVVGGREFEVVQTRDTGACEYSVSPLEFTPCMSAVSLSATIATQPGCPWTARPGASWMAVTDGDSGTGSGIITFRISDNWEAPRQGAIEVRWPTPTAGQNLRVQQAGCHYAVSTGSISIGGSGGTGTFSVIQQSEPITCGGPLQNACLWTAQSDVPWITISTSMPQVGDNPVSFTVAANGSTSPRTGTITVRDKVVRVTQAGS